MASPVLYPHKVLKNGQVKLSPEAAFYVRNQCESPINKKSREIRFPFPPTDHSPPRGFLPSVALLGDAYPPNAHLIQLWADQCDVSPISIHRVAMNWRKKQEEEHALALAAAAAAAGPNQNWAVNVQLPSSSPIPPQPYPPKQQRNATSLAPIDIDNMDKAGKLHSLSYWKRHSI